MESGQCADHNQAVNPFKSRTDVPTFPQCIWEVLRDHPAGLSIAHIVRELQERGLRDLSGLKKPSGQVRHIPCVLPPMSSILLSTRE